MAIIKVQELSDFENIINLIVQSRTKYLAVTDECSYLVLVPVVTSRHRHVYIFEGIEDQVSKLLSKVKTYQNFTVVKGQVCFGRE